VFAGGRQVGRATSHGWSPILKQAIALASVPPQYEAVGTTLAVEWTVEGRRGRVGATVVALPFLDLERKRA
jgi:glycine cleavage system aminomethyltransferase T